MRIISNSLCYEFTFFILNHNIPDPEDTVYSLQKCILYTPVIYFLTKYICLK